MAGSAAYIGLEHYTGKRSEIGFTIGDRCQRVQQVACRSRGARAFPKLEVRMPRLYVKREAVCRYTERTDLFKRPKPPLLALPARDAIG
jgi:hypothetical protein